MNEKKKLSRKQKGIALLICVFALLLVTGIALSLLGMADTETAINANYRDSQKAYFSALGGIQEARVRLLSGSTTIPVGMPSGSNATGVYYILNSNGSDDIQPWTTTNALFDDELCHENFPGLSTLSTDANALSPNLPCITSQGASGWYTTITSGDPNTGTAAALDYKWVRISLKENRSAYPFTVADASISANNNKPICWDGLKQFPLPAGMASCTDHTTNLYYEPVYRVASLARTRRGTRRMVLAEVANTPPLITNAAVDSQDHVTLNGQLTVNGFDYCNCDTSRCTSTTTGNGNNAVTTWTCPSYVGSTTTCDNSRWAIYASSTIDNPTSSEQLISGRNPPTAQNQTFPYDINSYIDLYKNSGTNATGAPYNYTCTPATATSNADCGSHATQNFGTPPPFPPNPPSNPGGTPQITYVPGNLQITGGSVGDGILIVDGDLDIHGGLQFYGLILVRGVVKFTGGGSDATNIYGAVLAGQESYVDNTLGGSANINFSSCALTQTQIPMPPKLLSIREATY